MSQADSQSAAAAQPAAASPSPAWERVQLARHPKRPHALDYIQRIFMDFVELHGDRAYADDAAIVGGMAFFDGRPVVVIGQQKGRDTKQKLKRNFGMPKPEGYRKALRLMKLAAKFRRPIVTLLDTPGAYPGIDAEERGQAEAIALNLREMARLDVPIVATVVGEGGSGGALGLGVGNRVYMMENAVYSVISPESCAAIVWRDAGKAELAAEALRMTASDLRKLNMIDGIIPEPNGGAHEDPDAAAESLKATLRTALTDLGRLKGSELINDRYEKFRTMGTFFSEKHAKVKRKGLLISLGVVAFIALLAYLTMGGKQHRVEVCMEYMGRQNCRTAAGATREAALRTAADNACATIASGMTESTQCTQSKPLSVRYLE